MGFMERLYLEKAWKNKGSCFRMDEEYVLNKLAKLTMEDRYDEAVSLLRSIGDEEKRLELCRWTLIGDGISRAIEEYGEVFVLDDREKYERARKGMEDIPPHAVIYRDPVTDEVDGLENIIDFIPSDNPVMLFYKELGG